MKLLHAAVLALIGSAAASADKQQRLGDGSDGMRSSDDGPSYRDELVALHKSLVSIPSVSGNENEVGYFLAEWLAEFGFHAELEFVPPEQDKSPAGGQREKPRFNVLAWPGRSRSPQPRVLLTSHIDTVPPFIPYAATPSGSPLSSSSLGPETVISGRGSVDAKASVAAQVIALIELLKADKVEEDDVVLLFVVGEETTGDGMRYFSNTLGNLDPPPQFKAVIFGEPTEGKLACGHKGFLGCKMVAHGKAGHSGYPWLGRSATEILMRSLVKLLDTDLGSSDRFGNTTVNVGRVDGGVAANVIAERAEAELAVRIAIGPQETGATVVEQRMIDVVAGVDENVEVQCRANRYGAIDCDCEVEGFDKITVNYGTDVANLAGNHTRYLYGPGSIFVAHGPEEALKLKDLEASVEGFKALILHALKK